MCRYRQEVQRAFSRWKLTAEGEALQSRTSLLQPVSFRGVPAMLKIAGCEEEHRGAAVMRWWNGGTAEPLGGAVRVLAHADTALLLERIEGTTLAQAMREGRGTGTGCVLDDTASRIICQVAARLHAPRGQSSGLALPELVPLSQWFAALAPAAERQGGVIREAALLAAVLLKTPQDITVLHGDLHHGNILDGGQRGWLAIDPKGLLGERGFDFANIFCNPDHATATAPGRLAQQLEIVCAEAQLEAQRLLAWITAWAGLSAVWHLEDGETADTALTVADVAFHALGRGKL